MRCPEVPVAVQTGKPCASQGCTVRHIRPAPPARGASSEHSSSSRSYASPRSEHAVAAEGARPTRRQRQTHRPEAAGWDAPSRPWDAGPAQARTDAEPPESGRTTTSASASSTRRRTWKVDRHHPPRRPAPRRDSKAQNGPSTKTEATSSLSTRDCYCCCSSSAHRCTDSS